MSSKMKSQPNPKFDNTLISLVYRYPVLWDDMHEHFRNSKQRHLAWTVVSQELNSNNTTCRVRWKALRDAWVRQKNFNDSGNLNPNRKNFEYYDKMLFLDKDLEHSYSERSDCQQSNLFIADVCSATLGRSQDQDALNGYCDFVYKNSPQSTRTNQSFTQSLNEFQPKIEEVDLTMDDSMGNESSDECAVTASVPTANNMGERRNQAQPQHQVVSNSNQISSFENLSPHQQNAVMKPNSSFGADFLADDECHIAGRRIGFQLKSVDDFQRTIAEKLISDIVFHAKMGNLTENSGIICDCTQQQSPPTRTSSYMHY